MKLKEFFYLLGLQPKPRIYSHTIKTFELPGFGVVQYAQWLHPHETIKTLSIDSILELTKFLSPGDTAIDIGAHTGDSSLPMALCVGKSGAVLALEPNPYVFSVLKKNSELNAEKTNIIPLMFAATPDDKDYEFEYSDEGFCNGGRHQGIARWRHGHAFQLKVQGKNLERFLNSNYPGILKNIRLIKVDAEGYDLEVLRTLRNLISEHRPYIKAEVFKKSGLNQRLELLQLFTQLQYTVHHVESESKYVGEQVNDTNLMKWQHYDVFCVPVAAAIRPQR